MIIFQLSKSGNPVINCPVHCFFPAWGSLFPIPVRLILICLTVDLFKRNGAVRKCFNS